jgi:hypothetical protein
LSTVTAIGHPLARWILSATTLRGWLELPELSCVGRIGHPLVRSLCQQSLMTLGGPKGASRFDQDLSKILAGEALPQPAFINTTL